MLTQNPFRLFFPLGLGFAIWSAAVWIAFGVAPESARAYPGQLHADGMVGGFLFLFSTGFLMTAVPKFTRSFSAQRWELGVGVGIAAALGVCTASESTTAFHWVSFSGIACLIGFAGRRLLARTQNPPPFFVFVGVGLLSGLLGALGLALTDSAGLDAAWIPTARALYFTGMMLGLVIGVGGRLLPMLLGHSAAPVSDPAAGRIPLALWMALAFLLGSYLALALGLANTGPALRAASALLVGFRFWRLHQLPPRKGVQPFLIWLSAWSIVLGLLTAALFPRYALHLMHLVYVSGMGLMTLMVATRVTLAHGGHDMALEAGSRALILTGVLVVLAALTRVSAGWLPSGYLTHLAYAAVCWILGVVVWSTLLVPRLRPAGKSTC
ncbi:MAG: NnrS family protein [Bdellovibrionales bacterium]|nr:NnrS family protein [Bdellovibrionales bacterium]